MKNSKRIFISAFIGFILVYLTMTTIEQLKYRNIEDETGNGNWACNRWYNYYGCDFNEFVKYQISFSPFIIIVNGVISIPVSLIIYLILTHRERVKKK